MKTCLNHISYSLILALCLAALGCRNKTPNPQTTDAIPKASSNQRSHVGSVPRVVGAPLFEKLDANDVGISFLHEWKPKNQYEAQLLKTGFTGGGVCMGDYDGDGWCDVYLTRPHGGGRLYRNLGDFKFTDVTEAAGVARDTDWTTGATFVDVDNDLDIDLCVSVHDSPNRLFLNNGGTFTESISSGLNFSGASIKTIFADYDNDGDLDAYLVTNRLEPRGEVKIRYIGSEGKYRVAPEHRELAMAIDLPSGKQQFAKAGQFDRLYKNEFVETGKVQFRDVTKDSQITGNFHGLDATWWDYDHDGDPDLYVANDFTDPDQWLRNNGDGTFTDVTRKTVPNTPWFAMGSAFGDLNNDGLLDLIATDMSGTTHYREKMAMGSMEAVAWFLDTAEPRQYMRNALYVNTGTARFMELAHLAGVSSSDWTWSVKIADLDNDGHEDIYATNGFTRDYLNGDFNEQLKKRGVDNSIAWYDAPELKEKNIAFRNGGKLHFDNYSEAWGLDELSICFGAAFGDLDNDGDIDLITNNFDGPPSVYRNGSTQNRVTISLAGTASNAQGTGAFVSAVIDGEKRIRYFNHANGYLSSNQPIVHFGLGTSATISKLEVRWPSGLIQNIDSVEANKHIVIREPKTSGTAGSHTVSTPLFYRTDLADITHVERPYDDFERQPLLPNRMSQYGPGIASSDINGDGNHDLFIGGAAGSEGQIWLGTGTSSVETSYRKFDTSVFAPHADSEDTGCLWIDIDNDNDLDLYVVSGGVEVDGPDSMLLRDRVYLNRLSESGELTFEFAPDARPNLTSSGSIAAAVDFDRDGDLDVFVGGRCVPHAYPTHPSSQLLVNEGGKLIDGTSDVAPELLNVGMATSAIWSDIDNDGWIDLLATFDYGPIRVFKNNEGTLQDFSREAATADLTGWWNSIAAADVDSDGDMDYAVGNLGRNTKYHPTATKPQYIYYGDFDETGSKHIVEAKPGSDGLLPVRGRSCSSNAMPFLQEKFGTYHDFAMSSLTDIYSETRLDASMRLSATTADSGLLINDGSGHFTFQPFPTLAQTAPTFGMRFVNLNDDVYPDLVAVQNFNGPQRETGRMNGGVGAAMVNNGEGSFTVLRADASGIILPEDAMGLVSVPSSDGALNLIASINSGSAIALSSRNSTVKSGHVQMKGKQAQIVGARIMVKFADGTRQVIETTAGGGYLSQSDCANVSVPRSAGDCVIRLPSGRELTLPLADDGSGAIDLADFPE